MERQALQNRMMSIQVKVTELLRDVNSLKSGLDSDHTKMVISYCTLDKTVKQLSTIEHDLSLAIRHESKCMHIEPMRY